MMFHRKVRPEKVRAATSLPLPRPKELFICRANRATKVIASTPFHSSHFKTQRPFLLLAQVSVSPEIYRVTLAIWDWDRRFIQASAV